ncbi:hypothetical protein BJB45_18200 [Halomonas huangheensis]|uniref:Uncharacterized protein n=1 Tax=Halomonas huangheensis TaxID=1178482 RepID=W1ND38_9GAMM|nr:hypothetical protein AR456_11725 [Halomonas huangheensis]ERL53206.1 hypothetical protein BJB45_18200 [Halomonas huangheensis]
MMDRGSMEMRGILVILIALPITPRRARTTPEKILRIIKRRHRIDYMIERRNDDQIGKICAKNT